MKYIVIGNVAILASRSVEAISGGVVVTVDGIPNKATLSLLSEDGNTSSYLIENEKTTLLGSSLKEGVYGVTVVWETTENDVAVRHEAKGNEFKVFQTDHGLAICPAPLSNATELENMWVGIVNTLEVVVPFIEAHKHGYEVI